MRYHGQRLVPVLMTLSLLLLVVMLAWATDPEMDRLLRSPVCKDWVTNGGHLTNQRYSTLKQIDTSIEKWENGYTITSAPIYYDGRIYIGLSGGEFGVRGRLTALDAKNGQILWRAYTLPAPGEPGSETWPPGTDHSMRGGATIWNT